MPLAPGALSSRLGELHRYPKDGTFIGTGGIGKTKPLQVLLVKLLYLATCDIRKSIQLRPENRSLSTKCLEKCINPESKVVSACDER